MVFRVFAVLVIAIVTGIPAPASAAGADAGERVAPGQLQLTINGQPLSRLLDPTPSTRDQLEDAWQAPQAALHARSQRASSPNPSWIRRHPVLFGAIVGAVAGAAIVGATVHSEASFVGFYGGGVAGAAVGWVVSR